MEINNCSIKKIDTEVKHENYFAWILGTTTNKKMNKVSLMSYKRTKIYFPSFQR